MQKQTLYSGGCKFAACLQSNFNSIVITPNLSFVCNKSNISFSEPVNAKDAEYIPVETQDPVIVVALLLMGGIYYYGEKSKLKQLEDFEDALKKSQFYL